MLLLTALRPPNTSRIWPTLSPCTTSKWNIVLSKGVLGVSHLFSIKRTFKASMHIASSDNSESDSILHSTCTFLLIIPTRTWKDMSLDDKITEFERTKLAVWDYPVTDKWTRIWQHILENGAPMTFEEALEKVRSEEEKFVLMGEIIIFTPLAVKSLLTADATDVRYQVLLDCGLRRVGEDMAPTPYALAVQHGSAIKPHLNEAYEEILCFSL